ncbi:MAG: S-methyl-5'-thioadenosine phosphorylase [Chloroflexi bacterium]|jgi:5'-methylthioadenosine phosphorylase|nr:MAG: putative S-methyl-5-thioadenosine phosphorylase [Chloroflexi bacterium OLB13]MBC6955388.1 S-methyl-5'-thioadenosine phosphorylase [Chloroflexota bacterium]MCO6445326.1 S-methyl-5'-thioadenosine phosphorylase [Anaerolineae bacterium]MDL1915280.1 S-methyl-5'-thioadenosine phosphorylase [Anaerolineae bacterium CFX4]OQY86482.1 MAG: methylthioadenosine phosphorylase [Anaerolineae bacterium UTCFX5]
MAETAVIGVIGGSGLYNMPEISDKVSVTVSTPFGSPSGSIVIGTLRGKRVAFLPRHGEGHTLLPSEVPYRANIYALKSLGVRFIIAANACGSLTESYRPGHLALPDQLYDNTRSERGGRTFFGEGIVGHVSMADPFSPELSGVIARAAAAQVPDAVIHRGGLFVVIEGPRFSTRGESRTYRAWGGQLIGMTTAPEAFLANEAEIAYAAIAHITDYDVWHESEEPVTTEIVMATMAKNIDHVQRVIAAAVERLDVNADYAAHHTLDNVVMTARARIPAATADKLRLLLGARLDPGT